LNLTPQQVAVKIGEKAITTAVVKSVERALRMLINQMAIRMGESGNDAFLELEIKRCKKEWCCIWRRYDWKKDKDKKHYQCLDGSVMGSGLYENPLHAVSSFSECEDTFDSEFYEAKMGIKTWNEIFHPHKK